MSSSPSRPAKARRSCSSASRTTTCRGRYSEDETREAVRQDGRVLAQLARQVPLPGPLARDGASLRADLEAPDLPSHGRHRRGAHGEPPGADRRSRNWDYRYTWIRDAAFSLYALCGSASPTRPRRSWSGSGRFRETAAGALGPLQILYRIDGRSDLTRRSSTTSRATEDRAPVRIGNGAADQLQLDIYGELDRLRLPLQPHGVAHLPRRVGRPLRLVEWVCENWDQADEGIWETRGAASTSRTRASCPGSRWNAR